MIVQQEKLFVQNNIHQRRSNYILLFKYEIFRLGRNDNPY